MARSESRVCVGTTKAGLPCKNRVTAGKGDLCHCHREKPEDTRCTATTKVGTRCALGKTVGCNVCHVHGGVRKDAVLTEAHPELLEITMKISELEGQLRSLREKKRELKKALTQVGGGKMAYYHAMKSDVLAHAQLAERLASVGLLRMRTVVGMDGDKKEVPIVPWQFVKAITDAMFDKLADNEKAFWVAKGAAIKMQKVVKKAADMPIEEDSAESVSSAMVV